MKNTFTYVLGIMLLFGCSKDDAPQPEEKAFTEKNVQIEPIETTGLGIGHIDFLDDKLGFAVSNYEGKILKTTDAGRNWEELHTSAYELVDIQFLDEQTGFVLASEGVLVYHLLSTVDGGLTFQESPILGGSSLMKVTFLTPNIGFALGNFMLKTNDGGATWMEVNLPFKLYQEITRTEDGTLYTGGLAGTFLRSVDEGNNWELLALGTNSHLYEIKPFKNFFYIRGQYWIKTDLQETQEFLLPANIRGSHIYDENVVILFGHQYPELGFFPYGVMAISNDSGASWDTKQFSELSRIWDVDFINQTTGFALADSPYVGQAYLLRIKIVP